jgi:hypothetical protein
MSPEHFTLLELPRIPPRVSFEQLRNMTFSLQFSHELVTAPNLKHFSPIEHLVDDLSATTTPNFRKITLLVHRGPGDDLCQNVASCEMFIRSMEQALLYFAMKVRAREIPGTREMPQDKESVLWGGMTQESINTGRVVLAWDFRTAHGKKEDVKLRGWRYTVARTTLLRIASSITASQQKALDIEAESTDCLPDPACNSDVPQCYYVHTSDRVVGEVGVTNIYRWPLRELSELFLSMKFYYGSRPLHRARYCSSDGTGKTVVDDPMPPHLATLFGNNGV